MTDPMRIAKRHRREHEHQVQSAPVTHSPKLATPLRPLTIAAMLTLAISGLAPLPCSYEVLRAEETNTYTYPVTRRVEQIDDYHGTKVADPYRWLEDTESDETKEWVSAQNKVTTEFLESIEARERIAKRLTELWDYERFGRPTRRGNRYFFSQNNGLQNQSVLYVSESLDAEPRALIDPNEWADDGTVALAGSLPSDDGKLLAYGIATSGSDWREWKIKDVATGEDLEDHLRWVKFSSISWAHDGSGIYYSRYDEPDGEKQFTGVNYFQKLYFHKIGDSQENDRLVYERPDQKEWGFQGEVTEDGDYLIIHVWRGSEAKNQIFSIDLRDPDAKVVELITGFEFEYEFIGNEGPTFWFNTDDGAANRHVVAVDTRNPARDDWTVIIPESKSVLRGVGLVGDRFFASYLRDAATQVKVFDLEGNFEREVEFPSLGTASGFGGRRTDTETFYSYSNYATPSVIYRYDVVSGESTVFRKPTLQFDPQDYVTRQVFYESSDGTRVPMFITHRRDLKPSGSDPTILYGYGGFDIPITPSFSVENLVWMERGGIYAVANLRGGGEYGRDWHESGMLDRKQNVFNDFVAAAQYLVNHGYTVRERLAIRGRSNGGLLVGACMTQHPELFGAALPGVGVMDMLRYHKFTIGWAWVGEYGSSDDAEQFRTLHAYSPLHNLKPGTSYPATMVTTADHDDRVVPGHSFKFAAALQAANEGNNPTLIRIETRAGHGAGTPTSKKIEAAADTLAFLVKVLDIE